MKRHYVPLSGTLYRRATNIHGDSFVSNAYNRPDELNMQRGHTSRQAAGEVHMPLQSQALKALSTRYADGHPLETCRSHLQKKKKKKKEKLPRQEIREAEARREGEKDSGRPCPPRPTPRRSARCRQRGRRRGRHARRTGPCPTS